jgi:hypothetical protein
VEFRDQVWPGDVLTYRGVVRSRREGRGSSAELELDLSATLTGGHRHLNATATVEV